SRLDLAAPAGADGRLNPRGGRHARLDRRPAGRQPGSGAAAGRGSVLARRALGVLRHRLSRPHRRDLDRRRRGAAGDQRQHGPRRDGGRLGAAAHRPQRQRDQLCRHAGRRLAGDLRAGRSGPRGRGVREPRARLAPGRRLRTRRRPADGRGARPRSGPAQADLDLHPRRARGRLPRLNGAARLIGPPAVLGRGREADMTAEHTDVVILGGGHNGLVCAFYLARAGLKVTVLERRGVVGGAAVTEAFHPGFRNSVASYTVSLLNPKVIADMELARHGLTAVERRLGNMLPTEDGRYLLTGGGRTRQEISKFSARDADRFEAYSDRLEAIAEVL